MIIVTRTWNTHELWPEMISLLPMLLMVVVSFGTNGTTILHCQPIKFKETYQVLYKVQIIWNLVSFLADIHRSWFFLFYLICFFCFSWHKIFSFFFFSVVDVGIHYCSSYLACHKRVGKLRKFLYNQICEKPEVFL